MSGDEAAHDLNQSEPEAQASALPDPDGEERLSACERALGHVFADRELLKQALTHSSYAAHKTASNERLEFLGDSVLGLVVCRKFFSMFPDRMEGELTEMKSAVVSRESLCRVARRVGLEKFVYVGRGVGTGGRLPDSILGNACEALCAAVYLDGGFEASEEFVLALLEPELSAYEDAPAMANYKSQAQEFLQRTRREIPDYRVTDEFGPDHRKTFCVTVFLGEHALGSGVGSTKKEAEQEAAKALLERLKEESAEPQAE